MRYPRPMQLALLIPALAAALSAGRRAERDQADQRRAEPVQHRQRLLQAAGGTDLGSTSAVEIDKDGKSIWVAERCGANSCLDRATGKMSADPTILKFDSTGKLVTSFGAGLLVFPHGIYVDRDGNVWVTDGQDNAPQPARGAALPAARRPRPVAAGGRMGPLPGSTPGHQASSARTARCCWMLAGRRGRPRTTSISRTTSSSRRTETSSSPRTWRGQRPRPEVLEGRQVDQGDRQEGRRSRRVQRSARARPTPRGDRGRRPQQQPDSDSRPGWQVHLGDGGVRAPERDLDRQERRALRRRLESGSVNPNRPEGVAASGSAS